MRPFEIEHIWADNYDQCHLENAITRKQFEEMRDRLGALLLLPKSDNAAFKDKPYGEKLNLYLRHNALAATLHPDFRPTTRS